MRFEKKGRGLRGFTVKWFLFPAFTGLKSWSRRILFPVCLSSIEGDVAPCC